MMTAPLLLTLAIGQAVKPPLPPPVIGVWAREQTPIASRQTAIPRGYQLRVLADGRWKENAPRKEGTWIFRDGVLSLRVMRGEDLWTIEKKFLLGKDGRLTLSADRPVRLYRVSKKS